MNTPHVHAELIKKWADGAEIEYLNRYGLWEYTPRPIWQTDKQYRVRERIFPKSSLTDQALMSMCQMTTLQAAFRNIADAAVKQYILDTEKNGIEHHA